PKDQHRLHRRDEVSQYLRVDLDVKRAHHRAETPDTKPQQQLFQTFDGQQQHAAAFRNAAAFEQACDLGRDPVKLAECDGGSGTQIDDRGLGWIAVAVVTEQVGDGAIRDAGNVIAEYAGHDGLPRFLGSSEARRGDRDFAQSGCANLSHDLAHAARQRGPTASAKSHTGCRCRAHMPKPTILPTLRLSFSSLHRPFELHHLVELEVLLEAANRDRDLREQFRLVDPGQASVGDDLVPHHKHVAHRIAGCAIDKVRHRIDQRLPLGTIGVEQDDVGFLANLDAADALADQGRLGAIDGRHFEAGFGWHHAWIDAGLLVAAAGEADFLCHVDDSGTGVIGAERYVHAERQKFGQLAEQEVAVAVMQAGAWRAYQRWPAPR